jgi:hypothetical protein
VRPLRKPVRSDISAALAIAVERRVEAILANARARWAFPAMGVIDAGFDEFDIADEGLSRNGASMLRRELSRKESERGFALFGFC